MVYVGIRNIHPQIQRPQNILFHLNITQQFYHIVEFFEVSLSGHRLIIDHPISHKRSSLTEPPQKDFFFISVWLLSSGFVQVLKILDSPENRLSSDYRRV